MSMGENPRGYSSFPEVLGNHTCTDSRPEGGLPGPCSLGMSSDSDVESAGKRTERGCEAGLGGGLHREELTSPWSLTSLEKLIEVITGGSEGRCPVSTPRSFPCTTQGLGASRDMNSHVRASHASRERGSHLRLPACICHSHETRQPAVTLMFWPIQPKPRPWGTST